MSNNKQQTAISWFLDQLLKDGYIKRLPVLQLQQAKEMEVMGKEMSYSDGYAEGYKRATELMEWCMKNYIKGRVQDHIGDTNKKVDE
jgi:hypothetical protein